MGKLLTIFLLSACLAGNCQIMASQMITIDPATALVKGSQVYQIGISLSDTTIKSVYWDILSGNQGLTFCFGHPKLFDKRVPDSTGIIHIYNPEKILKRGSGSVYNLLVVAYDARKNSIGTHNILYRGWEELYFEKVNGSVLTDTNTSPIKQNFFQKIFK